jgi:hypothetical protein
MDAQRKILLTLIAFGGTAVLGSYVPAFSNNPELVAALWGGVPESLRVFYTPNMLLAAASFFPATYALGFATPLDRFREFTGFSFSALLGAYCAILFPSALWLPLTAAYIESPSTLLWWAVRIDLLLVGLGASLLWWMLIARARRGPGWLWAAAGVFVFFWIQTAVLDATIWPAYFPR